MITTIKMGPLNNFWDPVVDPGFSVGKDANQLEGQFFYKLS